MLPQPILRYDYGLLEVKEVKHNILQRGKYCTVVLCIYTNEWYVKT